MWSKNRVLKFLLVAVLITSAAILPLMRAVPVHAQQTGANNDQNGTDEANGQNNDGQNTQCGFQGNSEGNEIDTSCEDSPTAQ